MKYIKLFEQYTSNRCQGILNNIKKYNVGDIVPEDEIYSYVECLHDRGEDFIDGNLPNRIEHYPEYKLSLIDIDKIDIDEFQLDDDLMDEYIDMFYDSDYYPPIVIAHDYRIIDGTHRANALFNVGQGKILAFIGQGNDEIFDDFGDY